MSIHQFSAPMPANIKSVRGILCLLLVLSVLSLTRAASVQAATIVVNTANDDLTGGDGRCTLREAIMNANLPAGGDTTSGDCIPGDTGADTIAFHSLLNGTPIILNLVSSDEHANADGDLDITDDLTIAGTDARQTIIDGNGTITGDRVFHLPTAGVTVEIKGVTVRNGRALGSNIGPGTFGADGGGILVTAAATLTLDDSRLTGNFSDDEGGALHVNAAANVILNRVLIDNNEANGASPIPAGGAIFVLDAGTVTVNNSTLSGNTALVTGAAEAQNGTAVLNFNHTTITGNTAVASSQSDGIRAYGSGIITLQNSIVSGNGDADCRIASGGTLVSLDYNIVGQNGTALLCPSSQPNDLILPGATSTLINTTLANNGGDTDSHALISSGPASEAILSTDNGCGTTFTTDQRGRPRPQDNDVDGSFNCDIGAFEAERVQQCSLVAGNTYSFNFISGNSVSIHIGTLGDIDCLHVVDWLHTHPNGHLTLAADRWWHIAATTLSGDPASGYSLDITLPHIGFSEPSMCKYPGNMGGNGWDCAVDGFDSSSVTRLNVTELSDWGVGDRVTPTAVTLQITTAHAHQPIIPLLILLITLALATYRLRHPHHSRRGGQAGKIPRPCPNHPSRLPRPSSQ